MRLTREAEQFRDLNRFIYDTIGYLFARILLMGHVRQFRPLLLVTVLITAFAVVAVACGSDRPASEPTETPDSPTPTPSSGTPTPTPTPAGNPATPTPNTSQPTPTPSQSDIRQQLDAAMARWNANRPTNYEFTLQRSCFCPQSDPVVITVNGAQIVSPTVSGNTPLMTVDELFQKVQAALDSSNSHVFSVEFERDLGYPISVSIDQIVGAIDDEVSYQVSEFRILPEKIDIAQLRRDLDAATLRWFDSGPQSYEFVFNWECFCPQQAQTPVRVRVEGGQIVSTVDAATGDPVVAPGGLEYQTVSNLFGWISQRLAKNPEFAALTFDAETGYPISARFNPILQLTDDEEAFFIDELTALDIHSDLQLELDAARALWESTATSNYTYNFNWQCFCIEDFVARVTVTVQDGQVMSVIRVEDGQPVDEQFKDSFVTVDELFDRLQDAIDQNAASIRAEFDPGNGLPTEVFIDYQAIIADEEMGWNADDVTPVL